MSKFLVDLAIVIGVLGAIAGLGYQYFVRFKKMPPEQALARGIDLAFEIWQASDFMMPGALTNPAVSQKALREAGLVLKAELLGRSTYAERLPRRVAKQHPELIEVDPLELAQGVMRHVQRGMK